MVTLSTNGASIIFDFEDSQHYLYGNGSIIAPLNSLSLVIEDDGKSITFKKGATNDIFVSVPIDEIDGMDADALVTWWEANAVGTPVADGIQFKIVNALPAVGSPKFIYLLQSPDGWQEWAYQNSEWIQFGTMQTVGYEGKDAIQIAKSATTASAYTVSLKIDDNDKFLHQTSGGVKDYANLRTSADTSGHQHIVLSGYDAGEVSNIQLDDYTGLSAISANNITDEISLVIDPASNSAITQSNAGLKLTAENNIKTASSSTRPPETREVFERFDDLEIRSAQTTSSTTYQLYSLDEPKDVKIEVINDKYTSAVTIDNNNQQILLDVVQPDKTVKVLSGNMEEVLFEDDAKDGLRIDNHLLKVKIDDASNSGLTVSIDGVKLTTESNVKTASASTRPVETQEVFKRFDDLNIQSAQTTSSTTYALYSLDEEKPVKIEVPFDQYVSAVSVDDTNQQILLDLKKADGSVQVLSGDATEILFEDDASDGLEVASHLLKVKIDPASNSALTVSSAGVKLDAESNIVTASSSTRPVQTDEVFRRFDELEIKSAQTTSSTTYALWSLDEEKPVKVNVPNDEHISAITVDNTNQQILLDLKKADGSVQVLSGDGTQIVWESDIKNGLEIASHNVNVKIDPASNSALTVSTTGVKLDVDQTIDSASTNPLENKEIWKRFNELHIQSGETTSSTTYQLYSLDEAKDVVISVPNDQYVSAVSVDDTNQQILLDLKKADGSVQVLSGNMENVIFESDLSDGLTADSHTAKVLIDPASNSALTVSLSGVKLDVEPDVKLASASTRPAETKEVYKRFNDLKIESSRTDVADVYNLWSLDEEKEKDIEVKDTFHIVSALPASGDVEILYILEETNPTTSAKTYTQWIYRDSEWKQTSSNATGGNVYSAGTNIDIYKAQPTDDFFTISGSQVVDLTQAEYDALAVKNPDKIYNLIDVPPYILSAYTNIEIASALTPDNQTVHRLSAKDYQVVSALPAVADAMENTIYLLKVGTAPDVWYDEYGKIDGAWVKLSVDLSDFILSAGEY